MIDSISFRDKVMHKYEGLHKCMRDIIRMLLFTCIFATVAFILCICMSTKAENEMTSGLEEIKTLLVAPNGISSQMFDEKIKRDSNINEKATLDFHPLNSNYYMTSFIKPVYKSDVTTTLAPTVSSSLVPTITDPLQKRIVYLWWFLSMVKLGLSGVSLYGTVKSCQNWSAGDAGTADKVGCVVGAVSTAIGIGATVSNHALEYDVIRRADHPWLNNINQAWNARDKSATDDYMEYISNITSAFAALTGYPSATVLHHNMSVVLNDQTGYPLHAIQSPDGNIYHVSVMDINDQWWTHRLISPESSSQTLTKRDEDFNMENFSSGGIEVSSQYGESAAAVLSMQNDWGQLVHETSCGLGDMKSNTYQYQMFDNNHEGTLTAGIVRAFSDEPFDQNSLNPNSVSWPVSGGTNCHVS